MESNQRCGGLYQRKLWSFVRLINTYKCNRGYNEQ